MTSFNDNYSYSISQGQRPPASDDKIKQTKEQVNQLTQIMQQNVEKTMQRGINLDQLEMNIQNLETNANQFKATGAKTKKKFWWKNTKWTIILASVIILLVVIIGLSVGLSVKNSIDYNNNNSNSNG